MQPNQPNSETIQDRRLLPRLFYSLKKSFSRSSNREIGSDLERRSQFLRILNQSWLVIGFVGILAYIFFPQDRVQIAAILLLAFFTFFTVKFLIAQKWIFQAGFIFTLLVNFSFFSIFLLRFFEFGLLRAMLEYKYILMMMGLAVIFAGAFIHRYAAFSLAALNSTLLLFFNYLEPQASSELNVHIFWWLIALISWLYESTLERAFTRLQREQESLEEKVASRTGELQQAVQELEHAKLELQEKNSELESFSYSVSHDLRAPLRALNGYSNALEEDYLDQLHDDGRHILHRMRENVNRMELLIQDLLTLSRVDRAKLERQLINPDQMVRQIMEELRKDIPDQPIEVNIKELVPCEADPVLLRQVFTNLLSNAIKFSRQRTPAVLTISSHTTPEGVVYSISDNGVGFNMQLADRLFSPFQRMHPADEYEGTGIGLSIVRRIVQRHGGRVWVQAGEDQGATFYFTLSDKPSPAYTIPTQA